MLIALYEEIATQTALASQVERVLWLAVFLSNRQYKSFWIDAIVSCIL